jgi:hypothetical protein
MCLILAVAVKHPVYSEKINITFEKYEPNNDSGCICCRPEQHALAWGGGFDGCGFSGGICGGGFFDGCGGSFGCGGYFAFGATCSYIDKVHDAIIYADCFGF